MPKRLLHLVVLVLASLTMLGAGTPATRFDKIGHKLMCPCGCAEILLECNHVGCPDSERMIAELRSQLATASPDAAIFAWFADKYGNTVLAAPMRAGFFDAMAWTVPFAVVILGMLAIVLLMRLFRRRHALQPAVPTSAPAPASNDLLDRIRRDTTYGE